MPARRQNRHHSDDATFPRRDFLILGAAAALAPLVAPLGSAAATESTEPISVGYLRGSAQSGVRPALLRQLASGSDRDGQPLEVVPAWGIEPDAGLQWQPLRIRLAGLYPGRPEGGGPESVTVDILFPVPGSTEVAAFGAWSYRAGTVPVVSPPVRLTATPDGMNGLDVVITTRTPASGRRRSVSEARRTAALGGGGRRAPRLCEGVYLLAVEAGTWDAVTVLPGRPEPWRVELLSVVLEVARAV